MKFFIFSIFFLFPSGALGNSPSKLRLHDYSENFYQFWTASQFLNSKKRLHEFKTTVLPLFPEFYESKLKEWDHPESQLGVILDGFPQNGPKFRETSKQFANDLKKGITTFQEVFSDFDEQMDIYVIHSLGSFDGAIREYNERPYLIFGVDIMAREHREMTTEMPFFHHELFHMYQLQKKLLSPEVLYEALWAEGLATYISHALNPGASLEKDLVLDVPKGTLAKAKEKTGFLARDFYSKMDLPTSQNRSKEYVQYFLNASHDKQIPVRSGYYLGYLVAKELSKTHTLEELSSKPAKFFRAKIRDVLSGMGKEL